MKHLPLWILTVLAFALVGSAARLVAQQPAGFPLMFRPQSVDLYSDMPEDLAKKYPKQRLVMITFQPVTTHAAAKDGSNLQAGEGSWLDRGMKPVEPGKIRFLVAEDDPILLVHTLKTSEGPFILRVLNSDHGYFETTPLSSPHLELVQEPQPHHHH